MINVRGQATTSQGGGAGRQRELTAAFLGYRPVLSRIISKILKRTDTNVEDIVQDTFLHCYEAASGQEIQFPKSFMARTATNLALNRMQRAEVRLVDQVEDLDSLDVYSTGYPLDNPVEACCAAREQLEDFCRAVETLPGKCRRAFLLKKVYGLSQSEIARQMGISDSTVEKHVAKGLLLCLEYMNHKPRAKAVAAQHNPARDG